MSKFQFLISVVLLVFICDYVQCKAGIAHMRKSTNNVPLEDFPVSWFNQKLDHFNPEETRTFKQRFYTNPQYYQVGGPIFLYINGEGPVFAPPNLPTDEVVLLAQKFNAMIVTLEHRYYGQSQPFDTWTTSNLQFLSSKQAINDLANFVVAFRNQLESSHNITGTKIFNIGCSYSGALSAWFRLKFPHITVGAISSSGVVNAILDFTAFDEQVAISAGPVCANVLRVVTSQLENLVLYSNVSVAAETKAKFNAESVTDNGDFFYFVADAMATSVQYGYQSELCDPLVNWYKVNGTAGLVDLYANYVINYWFSVAQLGDPREYATTWQQDVTVDENKADRQWWFQTCSELAYFQNAPKVGSIRSHIVNMTYHRDHCRIVFEMDLWPDTEATNEYYGGNHITATKVFFANASQDPWKRASVTTQLSDTEPAHVIKCQNCCHCVDVRTCPGGCDTPNDLEETRQLIETYVASWLE